MRRALSSERGFLGFFDLGFGLLRLEELPSLRDQGSGLMEQSNVGFRVPFLAGFGGGFNGVE